ncbi:hypothetical protein AVEN_143461-1 [Araneus ventricosus]|uniref:Uncharacterized protein n=1 Tax=Araneus ventricosus TaxID=182803 RepID=A0A4Y2RZJ7_ARAVE|nr:hypothetical protein AVEN_143461-1 [Araneus ventricosus]
MESRFPAMQVLWLEREFHKVKHGARIAATLVARMTLATILATNRLFPKMQPFSRYFYYGPRSRPHVFQTNGQIPDIQQTNVLYCFQTQFDVVSSANGWNNRVKASQLVASLRGTAAEVLQGISSDKLTDLMTIENALEARFGDSHLTQFYRTELKTRRQKPGESLQVLAADVERLMSLAYSECPQDVRDSLAAQYFVDAIRDEDTQHTTRLMDAKDLKSALAYSMKYEAAKTVFKTSRNVRSIEVEDGTGKEKEEKFDCLLKTLEKLLNSHVAGKKNTPRRNPNVT